MSRTRRRSLLNLCDANIVVDADQSLATGDVLIKQASYYYMGHFSRYFMPGMKHVALTNTVETEPPPLSPADIKNGVALRFLPCEADNAIQRFHSGADGTTLIAHGTDTAPGSDGYGVGGECMEHCISGECWFPKVQLVRLHSASAPRSVASHSTCTRTHHLHADTSRRI